MISVLLLHLLSTFSLSKVLLAHLSPLLLMSLRMLAGGSLTLVAAIKRNALLTIEKKKWFDFGRIILFALLIPYYVRYWALSKDASVSYWYFSGVALTYLVSTLYAIEEFSFLKTGIIIVSYMSLYVVLGFPLLSLSFPAVALIASVLSFAYGWIIIRRFIVDHTFDPLVLNGLMMLSAGSIAAIVCAVSEPLIIPHDMMQCIMLLAVIVLISNVLVHTWYMALLKRYSLTFMQLFSLIIPCWQLVWSCTLTITQAWACVVLLCCCGLYYALECGISKKHIADVKFLSWFYKARI